MKQRMTSSQIEQYINDNFIAKLSAGSKIPSERTLAKELGVALPTINKVLVSMTDRGLLFRKKGLGTFIKDDNFEKHVLRVITSSSDRYDITKTLNWFVYQFFLEGLSKRASKYGIIIELCFFDHYAEFSENLLDNLISPNVDAYVIHAVTKENWVWVKELRKRGKIVLARSAEPNKICHTVSLDPSTAIDQMLYYLLAKQKTKIVYLGAEEASEYDMVMIKKLKQSMSNFDISWNEHTFQFVGHEADGGKIAIENMLQNGVEFDVVINPHLYKVASMEKSLNKFNLKVPDDVEFIISEEIGVPNEELKHCSLFKSTLFELGEELCELYIESIKKRQDDSLSHCMNQNFHPRELIDKIL